MITILFFLVSFFASIAGAICGIGGGVIIKPVLDATALMEVGVISFLSGCTVLSMSAISVGKSLKSEEKSIEIKKGTALAIGGAVGGVIGKEIFQYAYEFFPNSNTVGAVQAAILFVVTLVTLLYTIHANKVKTRHVTSILVSVFIGFMLGMMSAFLGIGGGPINLMVLAYFFSMTTKQAAANSLYIILFSQATSFLSSVWKGTVPKFPIYVLAVMVVGGVMGALIGGKINKKMSEEQVSKLFVMLMLLIIGINLYNIYSFLR